MENLGQFFFIRHGVSELPLFKFLSFLDTKRNFQVRISENISPMTMKQVSLESFWTQDSIFMTSESARTDIMSRKSVLKALNFYAV